MVTVTVTGSRHLRWPSSCCYFSCKAPMASISISFNIESQCHKKKWKRGRLWKKDDKVCGIFWVCVCRSASWIERCCTMPIKSGYNMHLSDLRWEATSDRRMARHRFRCSLCKYSLEDAAYERHDICTAMPFSSLLAFEWFSGEGFEDSAKSFVI